MPRRSGNFGAQPGELCALCHREMRPGATLCSHCLATRTIGLQSFTGLVVLLWFVTFVAGAAFVVAAPHLRPILGGISIGCVVVLAVLYATRRNRVRYVRKR